MGEGALPVRLPLIRAVAKHRWKAFAGEVPSSSSASSLNAVDAKGRTIMTCTVSYSGEDREDFACTTERATARDANAAA